ncbi:helix-turn-helix transcriptional regulator [Phyllobacterium sp. LjRoot231]|uniref:helix-turn-helix transcriptional regulator n=1 Tax=Phyllobacterium sp. LjRoot231 TaxID=3342289 RepID=UPI003ECDF202
MTRSLRNLEIELTELIYASLAGESKWQDFLARLASVSPEGKATLFFHDASCSRGSFALSAGFSDDQVNRYNGHYSALNPWMHKASSRPVGLGVVADQMLDRRSLLQTEFYNDFLVPMGTQSAVGVTVVRDDSRLLLLSILTEEADARRNRPIADLLTRLTVQLQRAFVHLRNAPVSDEFAEVGKGMGTSNQTGFIIIGEGPVLKAMSAAAEKLIESGCGISRSPTGKLRFKLPEADSILAAMLGRFYEGNSYANCADNDVKLTFMRLQKDEFLSFVEGPTVVLLLEPITLRSKQLIRADT